MKKFLLLFLLLFAKIWISAQLDREHWFAPMVDKVTPFNSTTNNSQKLYLSTNRVTPFPVSIFHNNTLIGTVTISKGNPQKFDIPRHMIITTLQSDLFTPVNMGIHVEAEFPFYANLRFSIYNHAEIITSKGIPSTGTEFRAVVAPNPIALPYLHFMTSILATQDNTTVTVSEYEPNTVFSNGLTGVTNPTLTFTLNKGQSYIIDGQANLANNADAFIGAKIVSNKPVNVTSGNFNGQHLNVTNSSDILMDQAVPVSQLGDRFALVKGNGNIGSQMEGALVVATANNTSVFLNDEVAASAVLNAGQHYLVPDSKYISQGNNHYNMFIRTTNNAYVYQMLAGTSDPGFELATAGFNIIPALNCYLPKQIDEIGLIDDNLIWSQYLPPTGGTTVPTRLNMITEAGAVVTVNGVVPAATTGPFPLTGAPNWVSYGVPDVTGNITVNSTKAITAGITAGSNVVGYGGFFAGFPTTPVILTSGGTCAPGIILTADPQIYDSYQWFFNGTPISGATGPSYSPTEPGTYGVSVTMGSCAPLIATSVAVQKCTLQSTASYSFCSTQIINPAFSSLSNPQNVIPASVVINVPPTLGVVTINSVTGQITYVANIPGVAATDTFTYTFCGDHPDFPECETVTVTVTIENISVNNVTLNGCLIQGNLALYNLPNAQVTGAAGVTITYYNTLAGAQAENAADQINNPANYTGTVGNTVYAVVKNGTGCKEIAQITLGLFPVATVANYNGTFCDDDLDGSVTVNLSSITAQIVSTPGYFTSTYHATLADATAGINPLPNSWTFSTGTTIYIRVNSPDGCEPVIKPISFEIGAKIPVNNVSATQFACDTDLDGQAEVDINQYLPLFTGDPLVTGTFFATLANAQNNVNPLPNPTLITGTQTLYIRFEKAGVCPNVATLNITVRTAKKSDILQDQVICPEQKITLDAGPGFDTYLWNTGDTTPSISNVGIGNYWVDLTFNGCTYRQHVAVTQAPDPVITSIVVKEQTVTVTVSGGTPPYEYSVDGVTWQTSNVFQLKRGIYTMYVRDAKNCVVVTQQFEVIQLINAITPNEDGYNDYLDFSDLIDKENIRFQIFDRYGYEIFKGTKANRFIWDGKTIGGRPVTTGTYWYVVEWTEKRTRTIVQYTSWLLVKNRTQEYFKDNNGR